MYQFYYPDGKLIKAPNQEKIFVEAGFQPGIGVDEPLGRPARIIGHRRKPSAGAGRCGARHRALRLAHDVGHGTHAFPVA